MMLPLLLLQAALGTIPRQELPRQGCAAYLWTQAEPPRLVAMAAPERLRVQLDGRTVDLPRTAAEGEGALGLAAVTRYADATAAATVRMRVVERPDIAKGALVQEATLTLEQAGRDATVVPVGGMVGCG